MGWLEREEDKSELLKFTEAKIGGCAVLTSLRRSQPREKICSPRNRFNGTVAISTQKIGAAMNLRSRFSLEFRIQGGDLRRSFPGIGAKILKA